MLDSYLKIKYPSQFRSQIILTKADLSVNLGFTLFSQGVSEEAGSNQDNVTNGYVQFVEADYFLPKTDNNNNIVKDINGEIVFERVFKDDREAYFGRADIGDDGNPLVHESIKMVNKGGADLEKTIIVVHNQQSVDMSLFASGLELANHSNTERQAVINYNGGGTSGYVEDVRGYLIDMGTDYIN